MKPLIVVCLLCAAFVTFGCSGIARSAGKTLEIRGAFTSDANGTPAANVAFEIHGVYAALWPPGLWCFRPLLTMTSDSAGKFVAVLPYYSRYRVRATSREWWCEQYLRPHDLASQPLVLRLTPMAEIEAQVRKSIEDAKKPNKAPEPTTLLVTPRADARVAPSRVVAHL